MKLLINGVEYHSYAEAAIALGLKADLLSKRAHGHCKFERIDQAPRCSHSTNPIAVTINNTHFDSFAAAARYYDMNYRTFCLAIKKALDTGAEDLLVSDCKRTLRPGHQFTYQGVTYVSWTAAARALGVCYTTFVSRMKSGYYDHEHVVDNPNNNFHLPVVAYGIQYRNYIECARAFKVNVFKLHEWVRAGGKIEDFLNRIPTGNKRIYANGEWYPSRKQYAEAHGLTLSMLDYRMKRYNLTLEEAVDNEFYARVVSEAKHLKSEVKKLARLKTDWDCEPISPSPPKYTDSYELEEYEW